jgi:hypothetical protein
MLHPRAKDLLIRAPKELPIGRHPVGGDFMLRICSEISTLQTFA